jgi:hypothetical protein
MDFPGPSRARAVDAPADPVIARRLLAQAERHLASSRVAGVDTDSRFAMAYDAARRCADAVMRASGRRVTQGAGHHIAYLAEAKRLLGPQHASLWTRVEAARAIRNDMEYRAREVTETEFAGLADAAARLLDQARVHVERADG